MGSEVEGICRGLLLKGVDGKVEAGELRLVLGANGLNEFDGEVRFVLGANGLNEFDGSVVKVVFVEGDT